MFCQNFSWAEVEERNSVGSQNNLTTKISPDTEIPQADLAYLKDDERSLIEPIMKEYSSLFRRNKFQVGGLPHFRAEARMNEGVNCHQKRRPLFVPPQAAHDIAQYQEAGVFGPTIGGSDQFCSNLMLTKRPSAHMSSFQTLADKNQNKIDKRLGQEEDPGEQLVRLTCNLRLINGQTLNDSTVKKCSFFSKNFVFLGCTWQMDVESSRMNNDHLQGILNLHSPRSVVECASRLSTINYYGIYLPFLKRISLIFWLMVKKGKFIWTQTHEEAWQNVQFSCSLQVKNFIFQPHLPLLLAVDSSAVERGLFLFQILPN